MRYTLSQRLGHFFHVVSEIRPIVWICLYVCITPIFALIYWALPDGQFRVPDGDVTNYGSWLYYSIVTITTLGFGDYTPAHGAAQAVTAVEVMCGLIFLGLFLNAVGAMKSEIDVESEVEKQKALHREMEGEKLLKSVPMVIHSLNTFMAYCYALTTPREKRSGAEAVYNPDFKLNDLYGLFEPTGLPFDRTRQPSVERFLQSASSTSLILDSLQQRIDLTLWPELLEDCFSFVANCEMFSHTSAFFSKPAHMAQATTTQKEKDAEKSLSEKIASWKPENSNFPDPELESVAELGSFIKENAKIASQIEIFLTKFASSK